MPPSENPYASPQEVSSIAPSLTHRQRVKQRLFQPGLVTVISGVVMTFLSARTLHQYLVLLRLSSEEPQGVMGQFEIQVVIAFIALLLLGSLICVYGGVQMLRLKHYRVCVFAAVIMTIPFTSPCNLIGLVIGIWTLVILLQKTTRAAFAEVR